MVITLQPSWGHMDVDGPESWLINDRWMGREIKPHTGTHNVYIFFYFFLLILKVILFKEE